MKQKRPYQRNHAPGRELNPGEVDCIGRCGARVHASELGCPPCLSRLPEEITYDLRDSYSRGQIKVHQSDQMRARAWYCGNPAPVTV